MRPIALLSLAVLLALTSQTLAVARGQAMASGQMVICSGGAVVTVLVDAEGRPTGPPHICPDCALHALDLSAAACTGLPRPTAAALDLPSANPVLPAEEPSPAPRARAPPLPV